jgi:rare lipoprotein A
VRAVRVSVLLLLAAACGGAQHPPPPGSVERGLASWYGGRLNGSMTANGERFDQDALTAAHRTLPFGALVRVTNARNGRAVEVRINDRGPYGRGRIIDVSRAAARLLDMIVAGVVPVTVEVVSLPPRP